MPAIAKLKRAGDRAVVDHVAIALRLGVERGVKGLGHLLGVEDPDVVRQKGVEGPDERLGRVARSGQEVDDLPERVHARVGSAAGGRRRRARPVN